MREKIGFGIIGCGTIGGVHAEAIRRVTGVRLVAVADMAEQKAKKMGEDYGVPYYSNYRDLLERDDIDVVNVCLPSGLHMDACIDAANAGKNILCEKPLEITLSRIDKILEAVHKNGVKLGVVFQKRFQNPSKLIKDAIISGKLGKLISGSAYLKMYRTQAYYDSGAWRGTWKLDGGGCLMNQGIHGIDLLQWFMGPVKSVYAVTDIVAHERIEVEDVAVALVKFANGAAGVIEGSTSCYPGLPSVLEVYGTNGTVTLQEEKLTRWAFINPTEDDKTLAKKAAEEGGKTEEIDRSDPLATVGDSHLLPIEDMAAAVREDRDPAVTGEEGRKSVEIILAIYKSAKTGEEVELPLAEWSPA